jgi:hypothetical protein
MYNPTKPELWLGPVLLFYGGRCMQKYAYVVIRNAYRYEIIESF